MTSGTSGLVTVGRGCCSGAQNPEVSVQTKSELLARLVTPPAPSAGELVDLLHESHPVYRGLGTPEVVEIRGALLLALPSPLAEVALPFVLEELESPHDAYLTAVAARVLRNFQAPRSAFVDPLLCALLYIRERDQTVRLSVPWRESEDEPTTAMAEVLQTLAWLKGAARSALPRLDALREQQPGTVTTAAIDRAMEAIGQSPIEDRPTCCSGSAGPIVETRNTKLEDVAAIEFEDHDGHTLHFDEFFVGRPSIVVFFYTRCDNPTKCPLTITKLGRLQRLLADRGLDKAIRTAAITYDPGFDIPARLEQYRRSWGAESAPDHRMFRTTGDLAPLARYFELGVNRSSTVVNRHQIEAYVLDKGGRVAFAVTRLRWTEQDLLERAKSLL